MFIMLLDLTYAYLLLIKTVHTGWTQIQYMLSHFQMVSLHIQGVVKSFWSYDLMDPTLIINGIIY